MELGPHGTRDPRRLPTRCAAALALASIAALIPQAARAATLATTRVVAKSGDESPDGTGSLFELVGSTVLGASGQVAFISDMRDQGFLVGGGIFRASSPADLVLIARSSASASDPGMAWPAPDGNGYFYPFDNPPLAINQSGQVAFVAKLIQTFDPSQAEGIFVGSGGQSGLVQIARGNDLVPGGSDRIAALGFPSSAVSLNDAGEAAFHATWGAGPSLTQGFLEGDGTAGSLAVVVRVGDATPGGAIYLLSSPLALAQSGAVAFGACFAPSCADSAIYRRDGAVLTEIAQDGEASPDGNGSFEELFGFLESRPPLLDEGGGVAFFTTLTGTTGGSSDDAGIFRGDGSQLVAIARRGDVTPGGNGRLLDIDASSLVLDDLGQVLFTSTITGAQNGSSAGIFRGDGGALTTIARLGDPAPVGPGVFSKFEPLTFALNEKGQAVFQAFIDLGDGGGTQDTEGLFLFDDVRGLVSIARIGDVVPDAGVGVGSLYFTGRTTTPHGAGTTGLNARGQVAYRMAGDDGNYYVVLAPEPDGEALELAVVAALVLLGGSRRAARQQGRARRRIASVMRERS